MSMVSAAGHAASGSPPKQCSVESNLALSSVRRISAAGTIAILAIALAVAPGVSPAATNDISVDFGWSPTAPTPGQVVTFTAAATPPSGVAIKSYGWDLNGDGSIDKHGATATWSYPAPGPVSVRLRVKGSGNHRGDAVHTVSVQAAGGGGGPVPIPPVASFTIAPAAPVANQPVVFTSTSSDPDGTLTEQVWDLNGDGNYDNGGGATALRSFADAGSYVVGLRVMDDAGLVSFDSQTVTVLPAPGTLPVTTQVGTAAAEPVPGRADDGPDHRARDARPAPAREGTRADEDHDPLHRPQLPLQEAGAGGPGWRQLANGGQRPRSAPRAAALPRRPGACLRHEARRGREVHEVPVPRRQRAGAHRPLRDAGIMGTG